MRDTGAAYVGRFAPSPTGPLHLGSLFTALASFLHARSQQGQWLLRIDDLDKPRNQTGAITAIFNCLDAFGLHWDGEVYYQSQHLDHYENVLATLGHEQRTYRCTCSRKTLAELESGEPGHAIDKHLYPRLCRDKAIPATTRHAIRIKTDSGLVSFDDDLQGPLSHDIAKHHGDFILRRKDGIIAYPLAVVVDDALQQVSHVVRGCDLHEETPKQIYLQNVLGLLTPGYMHVPVIVDVHGFKLSKQTLATAVDSKSANKTFFDLLALLQQNPPEALNGASITELMAWAIKHWRPQTLAMCRTISG